MADQDSDLQANKEEFTAFLHPEEYDHMKDIVVLVRHTHTHAHILLKDDPTLYTSLFMFLCSLPVP